MQSRNLVERTLICAISIVITFVLASSLASAAVKTKNNAREWTDPKAWLPLGVPVAGDSVILNAAASIGSQGPVALRLVEVNDSFSIGKEGNLAATDGVIVGGELDLGGTFYVDGENAAVSIGRNTSGSLTIGSGSTGKVTVSEGAVHVVDEIVVAVAWEARYER